MPALFGGVLAALMAALCWTLASLCWRRLPSSLGAAQLNLLKNGLGLLLLLPLVLLQWRPLTPSLGLLLAASGVLGIAVGDSLFFAALRRLGTRRTLTIEAAAPVLTTLAALVLLAERPSVPQLGGLGLVSVAVVLVARAGAAPGRLAPGQQRLGVVLALLAVLAASGGALLARQALSGQLLSPWQAAGVRLAAAALVQLPLAPGLLAAVWAAVGPRPARRRWPLVLAATLLGTSLGIALQQSALLQLPAGQAVTLMATAPTMAVVLAPLDGDRPGFSGLAAAALAALGVALVAR
ncbi:MAG: EamA family transporter [Cyanobacteriota bacterium]|nr:EamA family transporter [Cyanobacteriota bacterium]